MSNALTSPRTAQLELSQAARGYAQRARSDNTKHAYRAALANFEDFAQARGLVALPATAETVIEYLTHLAESGAVRASTIGVRIAAIGAAHRTAKLHDPTTEEDVRLVLAGVRRALGTRPRKKAPITLAELERMIAATPETLAGKRDRALLLLGWAGGFRRSELAALDVADLHFNGKLTITLRKSKTDQEGAGMVKNIPMLADKRVCAITAVRAWIAESGIKSGALFRSIDRWAHLSETRLSDKDVARIVKRAAEGAGLEAVQFAGHSLRSGFITEAAQHGAQSRDIMSQTGHKSERVMAGYIQDAGLGAQAAVRLAFGELARETPAPHPAPSAAPSTPAAPAPSARENMLAYIADRTGDRAARAALRSSDMQARYDDIVSRVIRTPRLRAKFVELELIKMAEAIADPGKRAAALAQLEQLARKA
jgi:site-specific recombinase XerD